MPTASSGACSTALCRCWPLSCCWPSAAGRSSPWASSFCPKISSNEATIALSTDDGLTKEESYGVAGQVVEAVMAVDGVEEVGVTTDTTVAGIDIGQLGLPSAITDLLSAANSYGSYRFNVMLTSHCPLPGSPPWSRP
ncbi:MAG: hypothetical protein ACLRRU_03080 [Faecalibacterium sp.]